MKLAKTLMAMAAVALFSGCGPEEMGTEQGQEQGPLAEQTSALNSSTDPILGNWVWAQGSHYRVTVYTSGNGVLMGENCFKGVVGWKNIVYSSTTNDGVKIYTGQIHSATTTTPYCQVTAWSNVRFQAEPNWTNMFILYPSGYREAYVRP